jgi:hypothetical protein
MYTIGGLEYGNMTALNVNQESTNGCSNPSFLIGGNSESLLLDAPCLPSLTGVGLFANGAIFDAIASGLEIKMPVQGGLNVNLENGQTTGTFTGTTNINFQQNATVHWSLIDHPNGASPYFTLTDQFSGDNSPIIEATAGSFLTLNSPLKTGAAGLSFQNIGTTPAGINFFSGITGGSPYTFTYNAPETNKLGENFSGTTSPIELNGSAGTTGQCIQSAGSGNTDTWGACGGSSGTVTYTTSHTLATGDNGLTVVMNCSAACNLTLPNPQPSTTFKTTIQATNTNTTVVLGSSITFNSGASVPALIPFENIGVSADSGTTTNYIGSAPLKAGSNVTITGAANGLTVAASSGGDTITSPNSSLTIGGTSTATTLDALLVKTTGGVSTNATFFLPFVSSNTSGFYGLDTAAGLGFNPSTGVVQVGSGTSGSITTALFIPGILYSAAGTALPTCNSGSKGTLAVVSDATSPTYMGTYTSGGGITTAVICSYNGSTYSWLTH